MSPPPADNFAARIFLGPALRAQPDRRLVDLVRDGYDAAFEEIVRRYRRPLDRFAAAIVGGRSEDVTQDAFSKALLALRGTEAEIELRPWLYRIVRNTALNDLRDRAPEAAELSEALPGGRSAAAEAEAREELAELMERLGALPEPQRAALVMRELEGLSHEEIAAALGVSGGAARQAIYRARAALREGLGLLVPLPVVRALAENGDAALGAGASTAGGAALGGLGGGAVKAGVATLLVAGAVGAGVAVDNRQGERPGPEAAEAAVLPGRPGASTGSGAGSGSGPGGSAAGSGERAEDRGDDDRGEGGDDRGTLGDGDSSGSDRDSDRSGHSGSGNRGGDSGNSGPGSVSSGRHSGDEDGEDEDHSGSGSGDEGDDDHSESSGPSEGHSEDSSGSGSGESGEDGGDSAGPGSGEVEPEPEPEPEEEPDPVVEEEPEDDSGSESESSASGSGAPDGL